MASNASTLPRGTFMGDTDLTRHFGPVVLATDGTSASQAPIIVASLLAEKLGVSLVISAVIEPLPIYATASGTDPFPALFGEERFDDQRMIVRKAVESAIGSERKYELDIRMGQIGRGICEVAQERHASIIVVGAGRTSNTPRRLAGTRAIQVLRHSPCPVFSVVPDLVALPRRVIASIDFAVPSLYAAQLALSCVDNDARMTLVHVPPPFPIPAKSSDGDGEGRASSTSAPSDQLASMFSRVQEILAPHRPSGMTIDTHVEGGSIVDAVLSVVEREGADLIALGTHSPGFVERFFVGSVAATILQLSPVSVLAAPRPAPAEVVRLTLGLSGTAETTDPSDWAAILDAFTKANLGRRTRIEVDDRSIGGQVQASGYLLSGVTYDPKDRRVELMLGDPARGVAHLSRLIEDVRAIAISTDAARDNVLEIRQGEGHTLVWFD